MPIAYTIVKRRDMTKNAAPDSKLFYGQTKCRGKLTLNDLCDAIAAHSTASRGDVMLVLESVIYQLKVSLLAGQSVQFGNLGNFRIQSGSTGSVSEEEFSSNLFKRAKIIFTPGTLLRNLPDDVTYTREEVKTVTVVEECTKEHVI